MLPRYILIKISSGKILHLQGPKEYKILLNISPKISPAGAQRRCTSAVQVSAPSVGGQPEKVGRHTLGGEVVQNYKWAKNKQLQLLWKEQRQMRTQPVQYLSLKSSVNLHDVRYL